MNNPGNERWCAQCACPAQMFVVAIVADLEGWKRGGGGGDLAQKGGGAVVSGRAGRTRLGLYLTTLSCGPEGPEEGQGASGKGLAEFPWQYFFSECLNMTTAATESRQRCSSCWTYHS